jgi:hypothetical protein
MLQWISLPDHSGWLQGACDACLRPRNAAKPWDHPAVYEFRKCPPKNVPFNSFVAFCCMLEGLNFEISPFVLDVGKHLASKSYYSCLSCQPCCLLSIAQCHSKDDEFRDMAASACQFLAPLCSDQESVEKLVKHFFAVLNGTYWE